ncbi:MAG: DNA repair protein RecO [Gammaproteobacteria bacterium]|nr:DNA repair protein RecO [Gammaproteobacteria bacterium]
MIRVDNEPAFILHQRDYRETSRLVELFTPNHGRVSVVAKGVRRQPKKGSQAIGLFQSYSTSWSGRGELMNLNRIEADSLAAELAGERLYCGLYVNEVLMRVLHYQEPHQELFYHYRGLITELAAAGNLALLLRQFELNLLTELGYGLVLDHEVAGGKAIDCDATYDYIIDAGPRLLADKARASGVVISGNCLIGLRQGDLAPGCLPSVRNLMRAAIDARLDGRPLVSRQMLQRMRRIHKSTPVAKETMVPE